MVKGEDESWFRTKDAATMDLRDTMSVRVSNSAQDLAAKRPYSVARGEVFSDGEENAGNRWFPSGRGRMGEALTVESATPGAPFSCVDTNRAKGRPNRRRSQSTAGGIVDQAAVLCCCGPRWGRKYNTVEVQDGSPEAGKDVLRTKGRWEIDVDDEYYKPPVWKQIILKVKAQARQANCYNIRASEWVNYDPQSYEKNFDNGSWRDTSREVYQENDENEKLGVKERALHSALLQKFASTRSQKLADGEVQLIISSPALSPLPVRSSPKPKDEFVPIWQRRASSPVTLDVRQRS